MLGRQPRSLQATLGGSRSAARKRSRRSKRRWVLEGLENRLVLTGGPTIYTVNAITDAGTGSGTTGDLAYCLSQANANTNSEGSVIEFDPTVFGTPQTISFSTTLSLSETAGPEAISGPGANLLTISGNNRVEVFSVSGGMTAFFTGLTISGGSAVAGGGIFNLGTTTVTDSTIADNSNGGIDNYAGTLTISDSTVAGNSGVYGGGIFNNYSSTTIVTASTVAGNSAPYGAGVENYGTLTVTNSTFAGNSGSYGGGIENQHALTVTNCTIADNSAVNGGGILSFGTAILNNTVVALNTGAIGDLSGTFASSSAYNLIGTGGSAGLINAVNGNQVGVANPGLAPGLAGNGGPTETIALLTGSPAIDAGSNALAVDPTTGQPLEYDQRGPGFPRIADGTVDIGAFEYPSSAVSLVVVTEPPSSVVTNTGFGLTVGVLNSSGKLDSSFDGTVTVALENNPGHATLGGMLTLTAKSGVASAAGLTLNEPGIGYTLEVSSGGLIAVTTNAFTVQTIVAAVSVGWGTETAALVTATDGLRLLPAGRKTDLPWLGINQLPITLAQATTLVSGDVTVSSAIGVNYGPITVSGAGTSYIITLAQPIDQADRVTISVANVTIASFIRRLDVLPGDFTDNGVVDAADAVGVRNEWLRLAGALPTIYGDINGDGVVNATDYVDVFERIPTRLPSLAGASSGQDKISLGAAEPVRIGAPSPSERPAASRARPRAEIRLSSRGWRLGPSRASNTINQRLIHR
jgi:hypothetical protein